MEKANVGRLLTEIKAVWQAASEPNSPLTASPGYQKTQEKQDLDVKALVMMLLQEHMKDINKSLREIQEEMDQKLEALTRETHKSFKEIQENMGQQIEANKEEMQKSLKEIQENLGQQAEVMKEETNEPTHLWPLDPRQRG